MSNYVVAIVAYLRNTMSVSDNDMIKAIREQALRAGKRETVRGLVAFNVPPSTAEKLVRGVYVVKKLQEDTATRLRGYLESLRRKTA